MEETGGLKSFTEKFAVTQGYVVSSKVTRSEYTTNSLFFGHLANLFAYEIKSYYVIPSAAATNATQLDSSLDCYSHKTPTGKHTCTQIIFEANGSTRIYDQKF